MKHELDKGMRELNKYNKKKFLKVKSQVEVLAFGAYLFEKAVKTLLTLEHIRSKSEYFNLRFHLQKLFFLIFTQFTHTFI